LERGDYQQAATLLEEAVRLDPGLSRNQNNLAAALFELGRLEDGWPHVRQAVLLDPSNQYAVQSCKRYIVAMLKKANLDFGASKSEVVRVLGEPDNQEEAGGCVWYQYGGSGICFKAERFEGLGDFRYQ
jgi:tetratricopeptide (TPR) repeat protein